MLYYTIKTGLLRIGELVTFGNLYAGDYEHRNNPESTKLKGIGPLPAGVYWIGAPRDTQEHGPYFIPLIPVTPGFQLYDRSGFGIHGERVHGEPGHASNGCIIAPFDVRQRVGEHVGELLVVLSGNW